MISRIRSKRILTPAGFISGYVYFDEEKIIQVTQEALPCDREYAYNNLIVSPGFIDIHVHGGAGYDFCSSEPECMALAANFHLRRGTTTILPTITSVSYESICQALDNVRVCQKSDRCKSNIYGVHLEGPYFSPKQSGAQNPAAMTAPVKEQYTALVEKYGDLIKRWSYAPERDENGEFASYLTQHGIVPSMGHTDAIYPECLTAFANGCRLVTHLYSCTSTVSRLQGFRRLGVIETAYLLDDMNVEIIADGKHLPPELIQLICKIKGYDKVCLVTDAIQLAGVDAGEGDVGGVHFVIEDGVAKLPDRSAFAGSIATTDRLVRVCVKEAGIPLPDAVKMVTENPANLFGINAGQLKPGMRPDIVVFDDDIRVQAVFAGGKLVI